MASNQGNNSKNLKGSKSDKITEPEKTLDIYDQWRPPADIRYNLSQTLIKMDANVPKLDLKYTTLEYEPGQDLGFLTAKTESERFMKSKKRGPVWEFIEEIEVRKMNALQIKLREEFLRNTRRRHKRDKAFVQHTHQKIMEQIGPFWYHELSHKQMNAADMLKAALRRDFKLNSTDDTTDALVEMGIAYGPIHDNLEYAIRNKYLCPVEFLLMLVRLNKQRHAMSEKDYSLNDRIMLSAVVHLSMREILRELHLRIPSPEKISSDTCQKRTSKQKKIDKSLNPYLQEIIPVYQVQRQGIYKNRHKEYASSDYFDYVEDMYDIKYEEIPEAEKVRKKIYKKSKYSRPPKIPVRQIESKKEKRILYILKKPSPYISPCADIPRTPRRRKKPAEDQEKAAKQSTSSSSEKSEEKDVAEETVLQTMDSDTAATEDSIAVNVDPEEEDKYCRCLALTFNKDTEFELNIKIISSNENIQLTQKLRPYNNENTLGPLELVEQTENSENVDKNISVDNKPYKSIEYSCKCCICRKEVNLFPGNTAHYLVKQDILNNEESEEKPDRERYCEMMNEGEDEQICKCVSKDKTSDSLWSNLDDSFYNCTCKSSDSCTCCVCGGGNPDFLLKIQRFNDYFNTHYTPCYCHCKCKKKVKKPCKIHEIETKCKYCFCKKSTEAEAEAEGKDKEVEEKKEDKIEDKKEEKKDKDTPETSTDKRQESITNANQEIQDISCKCDKIYEKFLDAHESCMSLFTHYKEKIEIDVKEYITDLQENRCVCGDSESSIDEEEKEGKNSLDSCLCSDSTIDFGKCECCRKNMDRTGCTCASTPSSSSSSATYDSEACPCPLNRCQCPPKFKMPLPIEEEEQEINSEIDDDILKLQQAEKEAEREAEREAEIEAEGAEVSIESELDSRIYLLDEFPQQKIIQQQLLQKVLNDLANDGYPLAQLPYVEKLPHFEIWLRKRSRSYVSMRDRDFLFEKSKHMWNHIFKCRRTIIRPETFSEEVLRKGTWGQVTQYKKSIEQIRIHFRRHLKQIYIDQAQELFPTTFSYLLPTKSFRDCYFAYLPADENHSFVFKPWELHEVNDMTKHTCSC